MKNFTKLRDTLDFYRSIERRDDHTCMVVTWIQLICCPRKTPIILIIRSELIVQNTRQKFVAVVCYTCQRCISRNILSEKLRCSIISIPFAHSVHWQWFDRFVYFRVKRMKKKKQLRKAMDVIVHPHGTNNFILRAAFANKFVSEMCLCYKKNILRMSSLN